MTAVNSSFYHEDLKNAFDFLMWSWLRRGWEGEPTPDFDLAIIIHCWKYCETVDLLHENLKKENNKMPTYLSF